MKIGDRVREKSTGFIGTIVERDPPELTVEATRFRVQEDEKDGATLKREGKVGDPPPMSTWNKVEALELLTQVDTAGRKLDTPAGPQAAAGKDKGAHAGAGSHR
jgi:hypothetical protein